MSLKQLTVASGRNKKTQFPQHHHLTQSWPINSKLIVAMFYVLTHTLLHYFILSFFIFIYFFFVFIFIYFLSYTYSSHRQQRLHVGFNNYPGIPHRFHVPKVVSFRVIHALRNIMRITITITVPKKPMIYVMNFFWLKAAAQFGPN